MPLLSAVLALAAYLAGAGIWTVLAAFFVLGPTLIVVVGLILSGRADEAAETSTQSGPKG